MAGVNLFIEEKDKRWKENATFDVAWRRSTDETLTNAEQFHTDAASTYNRQAFQNHTRQSTSAATTSFS